MKRLNWMIIGLCSLGFVLLTVTVLWQKNKEEWPRKGAESAKMQLKNEDDENSAQRHQESKTTPGATAAPVASPLPPLVAMAIGQGEKHDFRSRLAAIGQLGKKLSLEERLALYDYLRDSREDKWLRPGQAFALKNDILNVLREQESPAPELTGVLLGLCQDKSQPLVLRDYAMQHLAPWYARAEATQRETIVEQLLSAAAETAESCAGTALLSLHRIGRENPDASIPPYTRQMVRLIEDATASLPARIAAVQLSGQIRFQAAAGTILDIARDNSQPTTLRLAAIAALGRLGGEGERAFLSQVAEGPEKRLKMAALAALHSQP